MAAVGIAAGAGAAPWGWGWAADAGLEAKVAVLSEATATVRRSSLRNIAVSSASSDLGHQSKETVPG